ncbi:MAG: DUF3147 family protein [Pseudohongiella sp.]|nr:DUF3147 family protein [Pseudohongiella sp.]
MQFLVFKYLVTAGIVVLVSETAKHSDRLGALIAALPTVTVLTLIWLYLEGQSMEKISNHAWYTLWYVIPTLPMFLVFPILYQKLGFWITLLCSGFITIACFGMFAMLLSRFGIELL